MHHVRTLIRLCGAILAFYSLGASATPGQFETLLSTISTSGNPAVDFQNVGQKVSSVSSTMTIRSPSIARDSLVLTAAATNARNDYSSIMLLDSEGRESSLGDRFHGDELTMETTAEVKIKAHTATVSYGQMVTPDSPFPYSGYSLNYNYGFFSGATTVGAGYYWSRMGQPLTYYTDPRTIAELTRPEQLTARRIEIWLEQVMNDRWKSQVRLLQGQRLEDRPSHLGAEFRNAYAFTGRVFGRFDTGGIQERRNEALKDERGYYSVYWGEIQVGYEVIYDLVLSVSAGTTVEREDVVWRGVQNQVGTDSYGLKASYKGPNWSLAISGLVSTSNTTYRAHSIQGDLIWEI